MDLISRQAAIDAIDALCQEHRYKIPGKRETYSQYNEAWQDALDRAKGVIGNLPSAQPTLHGSVELKNDYKKALDCILAAYLNPEARHNILEKFVFETFSVGEEIKKEK